MPSYDPNFFNIDPYYDDFDENKKFLRMLFRPGFSLQARELTQLQSILQNQVERFGNFVLDDGSMVFGGQITEIPTEIITISGLSGGGGVVVGELQDKTVSLVKDGITSYAKIIYGSKNPVNDQDVIFYQYLSGDSVTGDVSVVGFNAGTTFTAGFSGDVSEGMVIHVDEGIRYTNGYFVLNNAQRIGVYELITGGTRVDYETPNSSVGFAIQKSIVTSEDDISLRDPASGFYNYNAPGADRFKIDLEISQRSFTGSSDTSAADPFARTDFLEFARVVDGVLVKKEKYPDLGELEETFARRTYDESGHYLVDPFEITMEQHPTDNDLLKSKLDSGKAYVFGYEFETQSSVKLDHKKARTDDHIRDAPSEFVEYGFNVGPYILARFTNIDDGLSGIDFSILPKVYFDSSSGLPNTLSSYGAVDGVRFVVDAFDTENIFVPGATLYFDTDESNLTGGSSPGASAAVTGTIIRALGQTGFTTLVEVGPPYTERSGWTEGTTSAFETPLFYVAAGPSFEDGSNLRTFTGSNVSFFSTTLDLGFTGGILEKSIGTGRIRSIQRVSGDTHKLFLDDLSFSSRGISDLKRIYIEGNTGNPAFYSEELPVNLYSASNNSLIFESPYGETVREFSDWDFLVNIVLDLNVDSQGAATKTITTSELTDFRQIGPNITSADIFTPLENSQIVTLFTEDGVLTGELKITASGSEPDTLNLRNLKLNGSAFVSSTAKCVVACQIEGSTYRSKSLTSQSSVTLTFTGPDDEGFYYSFFADGSNNYITDVKSVENIPGSLTGYVLDTGQKDTYYDFSRLKISSDSVPQTVGGITVNYYKHDNPLNGPFIGGTGGSYEDYEDIPTFFSNSGKTVNLRNSIDFRPVRYGNTEDTFQLTGPYKSPSFIHDNYGHGSKYSYYLPRIDKIILTRDKNFEVIEGIPDETPIIPFDNPNAMTLYTIYFNPYTFDENDLTIVQEDNRRFTMKDIGNLERRIEKLEYYNTLTSLEQDAKSTPVYDNFGFERNKKVFLVDQFTGTESSDPVNKDFYCSTNRERKELRPPQTIYLKDRGDIQSSTNGLTSSNGIYTFNYTTEEYLANKRYNTFRFVNSNGIVDFNGVMKVTPHCDSWFSTTKKPLLKTNIQGENDSWLIGRSAFDMNDNFWEFNWFGKPTSVRTVAEKKNDLKRNFLKKPIGTSKITNFSVPQSNLKSTPEKIVDTSIVPYCRGNTIRIDASGLKPNKTHYVFFENENLTPSGISTDNQGYLTHTFTIQSDTYLAGKKIIKVLDDSSGVITNSTSSAQSLFYVSGMVKDTESLSYTRPLITRKESSNSENITNDPLTRDFQRGSSKSKKSKDNIAQLFTVSPEKYKSGIFLKKIDIYFHSIPTGEFDKNLPIRLLLKPVVNGYPSGSKIIATTYLYDITLESDGSATFEFEHPIFVQPGDYAIELETNSSDYAVKTYTLPSFRNETDDEERENVVDINFGNLILPKNVGRTRKTTNEFISMVIHKCVFEELSKQTITYDAIENPSNIKSNIQGSFVDNRYCEIKYGNSVLTPNTNERIKNSSDTTIDVDLSWIDKNVSPAYDVDSSNFVFAKNIISQTVSPNELSSEDATDSDSDSSTGYRNKTYSRYITKVVSSIQTLKNIHVIMDKYEPPGTKIRVFLKRTNVNSLTSFENTRYIEVPEKNENVSGSISSKSFEDYIPSEYTMINDLPSFTTFAVKIVFTSNDEQVVPSIKNLKVVAV